MHYYISYYISLHGTILFVCVNVFVFVLSCLLFFSSQQKQKDEETRPQSPMHSSTPLVLIHGHSNCTF